MNYPLKFNRQIGLDFARLVAAYLVLFGHFIYHGTFGSDANTQSLVGIDEVLPLLSRATQSLWMVDNYLLNNFRTAAAIIGVALFFLISGWVIPPMLLRYTSMQFIINRIFRIFPMLIVAIFIMTGIQYQFGDREAIHWIDVFSTMFLINEFIGHPKTIGIIWTLVVEFKFYLLLAILGRLTHTKIFCTVLTISLLSLLHLFTLKHEYYNLHPYALQLINANIHDFYYIFFIFIGSSLWIERSNIGSANWCSLIKPLILIIIFNISGSFFVKQFTIILAQEISLVTQMITLFLFGICIYVNKINSTSHFARIIAWLSNASYSLYLLHIGIGFFALSRLRHFIDNQYILLLISTIIVMLISAMTYTFIEAPMNRFAKRLITRIQM